METAHVIVEPIEKVYYYYPAPTAKGERVVLAAIVRDGVLYVGMSVCSLKDAFEKKKGRAIALGRAEKAAEAPYALEELKKYLHNLEKVASDRELTLPEQAELNEVRNKVAHPKQHASLIVKITDNEKPHGKIFVEAVEAKWGKKPETPLTLARKKRRYEKRLAKKAKAEEATGKEETTSITTAETTTPA